MTADPVFARRIRRLALTSLLALGLIWLLAAATLDAHPAIGTGLIAGWLLMPSILTLSLRWPRFRYVLVLPSSLVGAALLAVSATALPESRTASIGWLMITGGVLIGGALGGWLWYRWMPVPPRLDDPFSTGRWILACVHAGIILAGLALVGVSYVVQ